MGSRLEKNSKEVRKRIESHAFEDEKGEEYEASKFGGFHEYMRRKKIKLQNLDAELRSHSSENPQIFRGVVIHVNGYTQPSLSDLHHTVVTHGGGFMQYLHNKTEVTHIIASHLTPKKKAEFVRYRVVKPAWIVESLDAGKLLPWHNYRLVDEGVGQSVLGFDGGQVISQASPEKWGYQGQIEGRHLSQVQERANFLNNTSSAAGSFRADLSSSRTPSSDREKRALSTPLASDVLVPPTVAAPTAHTDPEEAHTLGTDVGDPESHASLAEYDNATRPRSAAAFENVVPEKSELPVKTGERKLTAEEHNAVLLQDPHIAKSSTANPDFLNQYYRESRLHHLSTWKATLKAQLQARANEQSSRQSTARREPGSRRYIMHVDFDSFFAAVSLRDHPSLKDKPVVIAHGSGPGSEIASCNYPAREFGIKNGMWMKSALEMCPTLKVLPYDYKAYEEASKHFYDSILSMDGIVQSISIDEALIDVSDQCIKAGSSEKNTNSEGSIRREQEHVNDLATSLRVLVKEKTKCDVSVGIGNNILLAKVALRKAKPAGQHHIKPEEISDFLADLTVTDLPGVAYSIGKKLEEIGVKYVKDVRSLTKERLINTLGPKTGEKIWDYSRGIDKQQVGEQTIRKSVSAEINWGIRFVTQQQAEEFVQCLCDELSRRLLEQTVKGKQLTMKIMRKAADAGLDPPKNLGHGKCDTFNKSVVLGVSTNDRTVVGKEAISILRHYGFPPGELRGLGVQMQKLEPMKPQSTNRLPVPESSQRRLQFKIAAPANEILKDPSKRSPKDLLRETSRFIVENDGAEAIEDAPTPEKQKTGTFEFATTRDPGPNATPLNISGTQFIIPTQVDPQVLAELPSDIRAKLVPKQSKLFDSGCQSRSSASAEALRAASPLGDDINMFLPRQSQLDVDTLAALPDNIREELLQQYSGGKGVHGAKTAPKEETLHDEDYMSQSFLDELPEAIRLEILADHKRKQHGSKAKLEASSLIKRPKTETKGSSEHERERVREREKERERERGQQRLRFSIQRPKPTFTSKKLSTLPELRAAMSAWVQEFSGEEEDGPFPEDTEALATYLKRVVLEEFDMSKATSVVDWLVYVIDDRPFERESIRAAWMEAVTFLKSDVQEAVKERGLAPIQFGVR